MTKQEKAVPDTLVLCYEGQVIGRVADVILSDDTWFGSFHSEVEAQTVPVRIRKFIEFCYDWNNRVESDPNNPPHPGEFDQFSDIVRSGSWSVKSQHGQEWHIVEAPVFSGDEEVSWRTS